MSDRTNFQRRTFLKVSCLAVMPAGLATHAGMTLAAGAPHVSENDPTAKALGYVDDATKADKKKFPNYKEGETCANCQNFEGKGNVAWGPCKIFPGKDVNAKGWCNAYVKKA